MRTRTQNGRDGQATGGGGSGPTNPIEAVLALDPARITRATAIAATPAVPVKVDPLTVGVTWVHGTEVRRLIAVDLKRQTVEWKRLGRGKHAHYGGVMSCFKWRAWCRGARVRGVQGGGA